MPRQAARKTAPRTALRSEVDGYEDDVNDGEVENSPARQLRQEALTATHCTDPSPEMAKRNIRTSDHDVAQSVQILQRNAPGKLKPSQKLKAPKRVESLIQSKKEKANTDIYAPPEYEEQETALGKATPKRDLGRPKRDSRTSSKRESIGTERDIDDSKRKRVRRPEAELPRKRTRAQQNGRRAATTPELGEDDTLSAARQNTIAPGSRRVLRTRNASGQNTSSSKIGTQEQPSQVGGSRLHDERARAVISETPEEMDPDGAKSKELPPISVHSKHNNNNEDSVYDQMEVDEKSLGEMSDEDEDGSLVESDIDMLPKKVDLYGQAELLATILAAAVKHKTDTYLEDFQNRGRYELGKVKAILINKDKIRRKFSELKTTRNVGLVRTAIDESLDDLQAQTQHLRPEDIQDFATKRRMVHQTHKLVFVDLISTLSAALRAHAEANLSDYTTHVWHLSSNIRIMQYIVQLYEKSRTKEWTKIKFFGVKAIRVNMLVPLKKVLEVFEREKRLVKDAHDGEKRQLKRLEITKREKINHALSQRLGREYDEKHRRLRYLFNWRRHYALSREPDYAQFEMRCKSFEEWKKERYLSGEAAPEVDSDGRPIERVALFRKRTPGTRPPKLSYWETELEPKWTRQEKSALLEGLQQYEGHHVFQDIFGKYCRPTGPLRFRTFPEILRMADWFRANLMPPGQWNRAGMQEMTDDDSVPTYIRNIPNLDLLDML